MGARFLQLSERKPAGPPIIAICIELGRFVLDDLNSRRRTAFCKCLRSLDGSCENVRTLIVQKHVVYQ